MIMDGDDGVMVNDEHNERDSTQADNDDFLLSANPKLQCPENMFIYCYGS